MDKPDLRDPAQWLPRELFAAYCGPGSDKLLAYYDKAKAKRQLIVFQFDWLAFFAVPAWFGYRQQWTLWATVVGVVAAATVIEALARIHLPAGAFGGAMMAVGLMAHGLVLTTANGQYLKLKRQGLGPDAIRSALADKARAHLGSAFAGLFGALAIGSALAYLLPS